VRTASYEFSFLIGDLDIVIDIDVSVVRTRFGIEVPGNSPSHNFLKLIQALYK
jgi:hypothetical protein